MGLGLVGGGACVLCGVRRVGESLMLPQALHAKIAPGFTSVQNWQDHSTTGLVLAWLGGGRSELHMLQRTS